jgi:dTDP-4-amino-4,6-dideoxygalactose transaminase
MLATLDDLTLPFEPSWARAVYHLYVIRVQDRQELQDRLKEAGIGTGIHYPVPLHSQKAYRALGYRQGEFPVTERIATEILSLPMFPQLERIDQEAIAWTVKECLVAIDSVASA